ncbi:MAG: M23 family metallopeptidase [Clostridiales Family XIII bacterium]|jgi:hypothetical protein|nr:M23 family metallopeptidase [Clostridiales Family XIII bacterium]
MRRFLFVVLFAVCCLVGYGAYAHTVADWRLAPDPRTAVMDTRIEPVEAEWHVPLFKGLFYKALARQSAVSEEALGSMGEAPLSLSLTLPRGFASRVRISREGELIFDERPGAWEPMTLGAGAYALEIDCSAPKTDEAAGYGSFRYRCAFTVEPEPEPALLTGRTTPEQGDIVSMRLIHVPPGIVPRAETELGMAVFTPDGAGAWRVAIPVGNAQSPGQYGVRVFAGDKSFDVAITVLAFDFVEQNLIVDTGSSAINEASSPAAYREYREKIPPLFDTYDEERYWHGVFAVPAEGRISTEFGTIRYTNGDYSRSRRHNGLDIAAPEGTPVFAPNAGRVVMAERLLNTGNTIVVEHGGGLKSYFFHLSRVDAAPGDMVEKGALIGAVGSTGYSTGPHLHYEVRIGNRPVNPSMLFESDAGLYGAADEEEDAQLREDFRGNGAEE